MEERHFSVLAVSLFGRWEVARYSTREQAEWRVRELRIEAERNVRGHLEYLVRPVKGRSDNG